MWAPLVWTWTAYRDWLAANEEAISFHAAKADVGAGFGKADHADALSGRGDDLHAGSCAGPDVAVYVAADAVGGGGG